MALRRPRTERSYPTPITNFDDRNRESYIARSGGIGSIKPMGTIVDYNLGRGGRDPSMIGGFGLGALEPVVEVPTGGPVGMFGEDRSDTTLNMLLDDILDKQYKPTPITEQGLEITVPVGDLVKPATSIDPTADDFFLRELYNKFFNPIDPENEGLPMDEFQPYDPNNPNMFMLPDDMDPNDMNIEDIINQMREPRLEATADTYTLPNLLQMLNDARDAGNVDEIELLTNDLEMMYPGATMDVAELSDSQLDFINSQMGTPDFYSNYQDYKDAVDAREEKPLFGIFGGQEPATDSEIINKLKETYGTLPFQVPAIV